MVYSQKEEMVFLPEAEIQENTAAPSLKFGWGKYRPQCLQIFNGPKSFLCALMLYTMVQALVIIGLANLTLPSIEKRFGFTAKELGVIASSNDVAALLIVVFISFYGDYGNKIKWIGGCGILLGLATVMYAVPHFLIGAYEPTHTGPRGQFCASTNITQEHEEQCLEKSESRWYYLAIFILCQLLMGAGISPFYSLVPAYLDENVHPKSLPIYMGIWMFGVFLGPGIGMFVGGKLLSIYVDLEKPEGLDLTAKHPQWIGAWWLGFVIFGILITIFAFVVLGFPRELPGARKIREEQIKKGNIKKAENLEKPTFKMILPQLKNLLTNWTFILSSLGLAISLMFVGSLGPFYPKILQMKFGLLPEETGYYLGSLVTPCMAVGVLLGSAVIKRFKLKNICKKATLFVFLLRILGFVGAILFLVPGCDNLNLAGVTTPYMKIHNNGLKEAITPLKNFSVTATCNKNCHCSLSRFAPVCGSDNITYIDMCHAGCGTRFPNKTLADCSCIADPHSKSGYGTVTPGMCDRNCRYFAFFATLMAIDIILQFARTVPESIIILRCVPDNKRAFASGIRYILFKTLGLLPGPILVGSVFDSQCTLWQDTCGVKGRCFDYDIEKLSYALCALGAIISAVSCILYFFSWYLYKCEEECDTEKGDSHPLKDIRDPEAPAKCKRQL